MAHQDDDADQILLDLDRYPEKSSVGMRSGICVLGVGKDVRDVHRLTCDSGPARPGRPIESMRMIPVVRGTRRIAFIRRHIEELMLEEIERAVIGGAESSGRFDDLIKDRLQPGRTSDSAQDAADRALVLTQLLELTSSISVGAGPTSYEAELRASPRDA